jgi:hypothetical protein
LFLVPFHEYDLVDIYADEGLSGTQADRPALHCIGSVGKGDALVPCTACPGWHVPPHHTLEISTRLDKVGADLVSLSEKMNTTSASGKMVFRLLAVWRDGVDPRKSIERHHLQHKKRKGERVGSIPLGKCLAEDGVHLVDEQGEQMAIEAARKY